MSYEPTTAGMSYSYNIPREHKITANNSVSCYKDLKNYGACSGGAIISPAPVSLIPQIFYNHKPHNMQQKKLLNSKYNTYTVGDSPTYSQYNTISQTPYIDYGLANMPREEFKKGFNDITY